MPAHYYLDLGTTDLSAVIGINGAPLLSDLDGEGVRTVLPINLWIMPKDNRLTGLLAWPEHVQYAPGQASAKATIFLADPQSPFPRPGQVLAQFAWPVPGMPEAYPFPLDVPFEAPEPVTTRLWSEVVSMEAPLTDADRLTMLELIEQLRQALVARDFNRAYELSQYKYADEARAQGHDLAELREAIIDQLGMMMNEPDLVSEPLTEDAAVFELVAGDRLVRVSRGVAGDALRFESEEAGYEIEVFFGKIEGRWRIVR